MGKKEREARKQERQLKKALKNVVISESIIKPDTRSVKVTDYSDGGSVVTKTETSGTTGRTTTTRTSSRQGTPQPISRYVEVTDPSRQGQMSIVPITEDVPVEQPTYLTQEQLRQRGIIKDINVIVPKQISVYEKQIRNPNLKTTTTIIPSNIQEIPEPPQPTKVEKFFQKPIVRDILYGDYLKKQAEERGGKLYAEPVAISSAASAQLAKELSKSKFDLLSKKLSNIEKEVANKKTLQAQSTYLSNIYKNLKTTEAKKGFAEFVQGLVDKQVLKLPSYTIATSPSRFSGATPIITTGILGGGGLFKSNTKEKEKQNIFFNTSPIVPIILKETTTTTPNQEQKSKTITSINSSGKTKQIYKPKQLFFQSQPQLQIQLQPQVPIQIQPQIQVPKLRQPQLLKQPQQQKYKFKLKPQKRYTPSVKTKGDIFSFGVKTKGNIFETFLRRRKKDISLGKFGDIGKAKTKLIKELKTTLGASGFITSSGKTVPFKELKLGFEFTPSKKQSFRVVQKRKFRLGTRQEVQEIQQSRRKIKWF